MAERDRHIERGKPEAGRSYSGAGDDRTGGDGMPERDRTDGGRRHSRVSRHFVRPLGWFVAFLLFLTAGIILVLQTDWGRDYTKEFVLRRLNALFDGAELTAENLEGNLIGNFTLTDVNLVESDGERLAHVDTLEAHYTLTGFLTNRLILRNIDLISPSIWMEQEENGTWDLFNVIARDDSAAVDTVETYWTSLVIQLDYLTVAEGRWEAAFYAPGGDSTLIVRNLNAEFGEAEFGASPTFQVDALTAQFQPPGQPYWGLVTAQGSLVDRVLDVGALRIASPSTFVRGQGRLRLPTEDNTYVDDVNFGLMANPLNFDDIRPFVPGLHAQGKADLLVHVEGSGRRLVIDGDAAFSRGGTVSVDGVLSPGSQDSLEYVVEGEIRSLNPTTLLGSGVESGIINADLDVNLRGTQADQLNGEIDASVFNSRYGAYELAEATLTSTVDDGLADFELRTGMRGASISAEGTARPFDDIPVYDFSARVDDLDLGRFTDGGGLATDLSGSMAVEGSGFDLQTAEIDADVRLAPSTINDYLIEDALLDLHLENGDLSFGARVLVPEGRFTAEGDLAFEDELAYNIRRGQFENFDLAALAGADTTRSSFTGSFALQGRGTDPQTLDLTFDVNLDRGFYGRIAIADAAANGSLQDGLLRASADIDLEEAGSFDLAVSTRPFEGAETLVIDRGIFRNVDLEALTGSTGLSTDLTGSLAGSLRGFDPETMVFDGRIDLDPSRINEQPINDATLIADLNAGNLDFDLFVSIPGGQANLEGTAQPFDEVPTYVVRDGTFENINLGTFTGNPGLATSLSGNVSLRGRGFDPQTMTLEGTFDLQPSRINQQQVNDALLTVNMQRGNLGFDLRLDLPEGDTRLSGTADLLAAVPTYRIEEGTFQNFNVGALLGNPNLQTNLTGTLSLRGRGFDPATGTASGSITLGPSSINDQRIDAATLTGELTQGTLDYNLTLDLPEGQTQLAGIADFSQEPVYYVVQQGSFQNLDLGALTGNPALRGDLTGTLSLEGRGFDPETLALNGTVRLDSSQINQQLIESAVADINLDQGNLAYTVVLDAPEGESRLVGTAQPFLETPAYAVTEGTLDNLNVGALLGRSDLQTNLTGTITLEGQGFDPETMFLELNANLASSQINEATIIDGEIDALLRDGLVQVDTDLIFEEGRAQVQASVQPFLERPVYQATGTLVNVDFGDIVGTDTLQAHFNAEFDVQGEGLDLETMAIEGTVRAASSRFEEIAVDSLYADFQLADGLMQLDTLLLRSNIADATGGGQIALFDPTGTRISDFHFDAQIKDVEPIQPFLDAQSLAIGEGHIEGRVFGREGNLNFDLTTDISSFVYNDIRLSGLEGRIAGRLGPDRQLQLGEVRASFDFLTLPGLSLQGSNFEIAYEGNDIVFEGDVVIDERREARVSGRVDLSPDNRRMEIEDFTMRFEDNQWQLLQPASITLGGEYRISNFLLYSEDQQIAIDGVIDPNGEQNLVLTIESFRLATVADLVGFGGLDGTATGSLVMSGPAFAPTVEGALNLDLISEGEPVGDLQVELLYDDLRLNIDALLLNEQQGRLAVNGFIPLDLRLAPGDSTVVAAGVPTEGLRVRTAESAAASEVQLAIAADTFSLGWIKPFLDPETYAEIGGIVQADVTVTGTMGDPNLDGTLSLTNGQLRLAELDVLWAPITAEATLVDNVIQLQHATLISDGEMTAQGTIEFQELTLGQFDIDLILDNFRVIDNLEYDNMIVSGTPHLSGTITRPVVTGAIQVESGDIYVENAIAPDFEVPPLTQRDLNMIEQVFGYRVTAEDTTTFVLFDALSLNATLDIQRNTWIRQRTNPEMAIQITGTLDTFKEPFGDIQLFGTIEVVPERSYIEQFGRRFDMTSGTITLSGPPEGFRIDAQAEYTVRDQEGGSEVTITLGIQGQQGNLELALESDLGLSNADIVSYIATGRMSNITLGVGRDLALTQLTSMVENFAGQELGLDVVEIEFDVETGGTQLVVGEYVSNDLFVAVSQLLNSRQSAGGTSGAPATEFTVEYEIIDWLLLRFIGGRSSLRINLLYEQAY